MSGKISGYYFPTIGIGNGPWQVRLSISYNIKYNITSSSFTMFWDKWCTLRESVKKVNLI